jgi:hypothetical protein
MSCLSCDVEFGGNLNAFIDHMTDTHSDDSIQCMHCDELSSSGAEYAMHFIYSHNADEEILKSPIEEVKFLNHFFPDSVVA